MAGNKPHDKDSDRLRSLLREELATFHEALVLELRNMAASAQMSVPNQFGGKSNAPNVAKELGDTDESKKPLCQKHEQNEKLYRNTDSAKEEWQNDKTTTSTQPDGSSDSLQSKETQATEATCVDVPGVLKNTRVDLCNSAHSQRLFSSVKIQDHFIDASAITSSLNCERDLNDIQVGQGDNKSGRMQRQGTQSGLDVPEAKMKVGAFGGLTSKPALDNLTEEMYDVSIYYHDKGFAQKIARNDKFMNFTLFMIALNTLYIGIDQDNNPSDFIFYAPWPFQVCENFFGIFFCGELLLRFLAFKRKRDCLRDLWFKIDSSLIILMVGEMWLVPILLKVANTVGKGGPNASFLRLLRLLRLSRMLRALRFMPELVSMVKGMRAAAQAVFTALAMILALMYIFAVVMNMILKDEPTVYKYFSSLEATMWTLTLDGVLADSPGLVIRLLASSGTWSGRLGVLIFMLFILISCFFLMNMLIGVLCEVVNTVANREKDEAAVNLIRETILLLLKQFDSDGNGMINQTELRMVMEDPRAVEVLKSLEVDVTYLEELQAMLFIEPDSEVRIHNALELLLSCRGSLPTTVKHMVSGQAFTRWMMCSAMKEQQETFAAQLRAATNKMVALVEIGGKPATCLKL